MHVQYVLQTIPDSFISFKCFIYSNKKMILFHYIKINKKVHLIIRSGMLFYMCGFSFTFYFLFCMWCRTCTVTGKSSKDKENVRLTGFDVIRERHNSNSDAPFTNSIVGPSEGVLQSSPLPTRFISLALTTAVWDMIIYSVIDDPLKTCIDHFLFSEKQLSFYYK